MNSQPNTPPDRRPTLVGYLCDAAGKPEYFIGVNNPTDPEDDHVQMVMYNNAQPEAATASVALSVFGPYDFFHRDYPLLEITAELGQRLCLFLQSPHRDCPQRTNWQVALDWYNHDWPQLKDSDVPRNLPIPDYAQIAAPFRPGFSTVARDYLHEFCLAVNPMADSATSAYFELYDTTNARHASFCARISFLSPDYVSLPAVPDDWILPEHYKVWLMDFLRSHRRGRRDAVEEMSNWQYALARWNVEMGFIDDPEEAWDITEADCVPLSPHAPHPLPLSLPMPDYMLLREDD